MLHSVDQMKAIADREIEAHRGDPLAPLLLEACAEIKAVALNEIRKRAEKAFADGVRPDMAERIMGACDHLAEMIGHLDTEVARVEAEKAAEEEGVVVKSTSATVAGSSEGQAPAGQPDLGDSDGGNPGGEHTTADGGSPFAGENVAPGAAGGSLEDDPDADKPVVPTDG